MRRSASLLLAASLLLGLLAGCGAAPAPDGAVDVDLTALSDTMVYAEVSHMTSAPGDYTGQTVKLRGQYRASFYDETQQYYHYVIFTDATACCEQGLEFVWSGEHRYPDDYPADGAEIELCGVFGSYEELGVTYHCLNVDAIRVL